jgi:hypothetical protein
VRLAEQYQATRDAVGRIVARAFARKGHVPRIRDPWYLEPEGDERPRGLTPETGLDEAIAGFARATGRETVPLPDGGMMVGAPARRAH